MYHTDPEVTAALARIETNVNRLVERVAPDVESRLRTLERWRWGTLGGFAVLAGLVKGFPAWLK